jgi:predicted aspartyl protease
MGTFRVEFEVGNPEGRRFERLQALVDTGASHTVVPSSLLRSLGVPVRWRWQFQMADDRVVERDAGYTLVRLDGRVAPTVVVFGDEGVEALLGAATLETFSLAMDPVRRRLVPVPGLLKAAR